MPEVSIDPRQGARSVPTSECRMLALVTDAFGGYGGIAQYNRDFLTAAALSELFSEITVLPRLAPLPSGTVPKKVVQLAAAKSRLAYALRAVRVATQLRPEIIFNAHIYHGSLALALARLTGARLISQVHGTEVWDGISAPCRRALEESDLVLAVSRDTRARLLSAINIAPEKVAVLGNTVGDEFTPGDRDEARGRFQLGEEFAILTVSRLDEHDGYKGHDRIIRLLPELRRGGRKVTYLIAGSGPDRDRLMKLAADLHLEAEVRFLGMVPAGHLPDLYRAADLFALPSTGEGFGIVFLEAMCCGTPAIGVSVGGVPDALGDGTLGICVSPEQFDQALIAELELASERDTSLPDRVRQRYGREQFSSALAARLETLLKGAAT